VRRTDEAYSIVYAESHSDLEQVMAVYRANKRELGFLPDGAFEERLQRRQILVAKLGETIAGYVLFAVNQKREVRIAHLAVENKHRGQGLSRSLVDRLRRDFATHSRIRLNCRSDFEAVKIWHSLGFVAGKRVAGKKINGSELIVFSSRLNDMPLFDQLSNQNDQPLVVCDANVCIDIRYPDRPRHENASGLLADWLADEISLVVTEEILNDLDRQPEPLRGQMISTIRTTWEVIVGDVSTVDRFRGMIRSILGEPKDPSAVSDQQHLAIAASCNAAAFATYDDELLKKAPDILGLTGLRVQRPSEIISELDSVVRSAIYQYREMRNTGIERHRVKSIQELGLDDFTYANKGEKPQSLSGLVDGALSLPDRFEINQIRDTEGNSLAIVLSENAGPSLTNLVRFRVARRLSGQRLGNVITELIASQPLGTSTTVGIRVVKLSDPLPEPSLLLACLRRGFQRFDQEYFRVLLPGIWDHAPLQVVVRQLVSENCLPSELGDAILQLSEKAAGGDIASTQRLEALIHPGKVTFGKLPVYVVPIQPEWAQELFDFRIWSRPLLRMDTRLVVNPDSVYYKKPRNSPKGDFARILWYVSGDKQRGGGCIRACSASTKGVKGTVKDLYREYQRLGVFEWRHLMDHFGKPEATAFAMEFTNTELFPTTISRDELNTVLAEGGMKRQQFVSAVEISQAAFEKIYRQASQ
jgi:ribosomal protein S18 acetylase RimI-like enzyme